MSLSGLISHRVDYWFKTGEVAKMAAQLPCHFIQCAQLYPPKIQRA